MGSVTAIQIKFKIIDITMYLSICNEECLRRNNIVKWWGCDDVELKIDFGFVIEQNLEGQPDWIRRNFINTYITSCDETINLSSILK